MTMMSSCLTDPTGALCLAEYRQALAWVEILRMADRSPRVTRTRDEGLLPKSLDGMAYGSQYAITNTNVGGMNPCLPFRVPPAYLNQPYFQALYNPSPASAVEAIGFGKGHCCDYAAAGMPCLCASTGMSPGVDLSLEEEPPWVAEWAHLRRGRDGSLPIHYAMSALQGYGMVDSDWPGLDSMMGVSHGPFVTYPEAFALHGRENLQVCR